ncbi:hypothetical protein ACFL02_08030, partial [Planctomycetota bacterium]
YGRFREGGLVYNIFICIDVGLYRMVGDVFTEAEAAGGGEPATATAKDRSEDINTLASGGFGPVGDHGHNAGDVD